jgi:uroporphyrinogen-III decarboxylase
MNAIERIRRTFEGKTVDRVPTFSAGMEDRTYNDVLGQSLITQKMMIRNPVTQFTMNKWGPPLTKPVFQRFINQGLVKRIKAAAKLGFDATWGTYDESFVFKDGKTMVRFTGAIFNIYDDGHGNTSYQYRGPGITSRQEFEEWPYWPDIDAVAHRAYKFYRKMMRKYGDKMYIFGQASAYGMHESMLWALGVQRMAIWMVTEKDLVQEYIRKGEELLLKTAMAMMDAGIDVIMHSDDFAFKSGPFFNPKQIEAFFGPSYKRVIKAVHDRGGKFVLHSCGDNTLLFDMFLQWGVDGLHAYEPTSNVDIVNEKKIRGDKTVIIGGMGIDYMLTDRSTDEDVVEEVKRLIQKLAPGGKFILAPTHSMSSVPGEKLKVMIDAVKEFGQYPIGSH